MRRGARERVALHRPAVVLVVRRLHAFVQVRDVRVLAAADRQAEGRLEPGVLQLAERRAVVPRRVGQGQRAPGVGLAGARPNRREQRELLERPGRSCPGLRAGTPARGWGSRRAGRLHRPALLVHRALLRRHGLRSHKAAGAAAAAAGGGRRRGRECRRPRLPLLLGLCSRLRLHRGLRPRHRRRPARRLPALRRLLALGLVGHARFAAVHRAHHRAPRLHPLRGTYRLSRLVSLRAQQEESLWRTARSASVRRARPPRPAPCAAACQIATCRPRVPGGQGAPPARQRQRLHPATARPAIAYRRLLALRPLGLAGGASSQGPTATARRGTSTKNVGEG